MRGACVERLAPALALACPQGRLEAHESVACHTLAGLPCCSASAAAAELPPLLLIDTAGCAFEEAPEADGDSRSNEGEARAALAHVRRLLAVGLAPADVGIITPYSAQVLGHIRRLAGCRPPLATATHVLLPVALLRWWLLHHARLVACTPMLLCLSQCRLRCSRSCVARASRGWRCRPWTASKAVRRRPSSSAWSAGVSVCNRSSRDQCAGLSGCCCTAPAARAESPELSCARARARCGNRECPVCARECFARPETPACVRV